MERKEFYKLIRDKIPERIAANGARARIRILEVDEYIDALKQKLIEESAELKHATAETILDEVADVKEVLDAIVKALGLNQTEIEVKREEKREKNGGFEKRIFLEWTEE